MGSYISGVIFSLFRTQASVTRQIEEAKGCFYSSDLSHQFGFLLEEAMLTPNSSVAQVLLSASNTTQSIAPGGMGFGSYQSISWGWGIGVMLGIYVAGKFFG